MRKHRAKRTLLTLLALAGYALLLPLWARRRRARRGEHRILTFHSVHPRRRHETTIRPDAFAAHLALLARHAEVQDLDALAREGGAGRAPPARRPRVALTFDDGYADNLYEALPLLRRFGLTATCFVTAGCLGSPSPLPHDAGEPLEDVRLMTWDEARAWRAAGMTVGSHGLTHARLGALPDAELERELRESQALIRRELGEDARVLSCPYGRSTDVDRRVVAAAKAAGYEAVALAAYGWNDAGSDRFALRRIGVESSDTAFTLRAKLNGALDLLALFESPAARRAIARLNRIFGG